MKSITKSTIAASLFLISAVAFAQVIELDNTNADHCRQQLLQGKDEFPVIFFYMNGCPWAEKLMPIYKEVASENPNRNFYAFNYQEHDAPHTSYLRAAHGCLEKMPVISPTVTIYFIDRDFPSGSRIIGEIKAGLNGMSSKADVENFIKSAPNGNANNIKSSLTTDNKN